VSAAFDLGSEASAAQAAGETGNAGTPGQAAYEAWEIRVAGVVRVPWPKLGDGVRDLWELIASGAIAAPDAAQVDITRIAAANTIRRLREELDAAREPQPAPAWLDDLLENWETDAASADERADEPAGTYAQSPAELRNEAEAIRECAKQLREAVTETSTAPGPQPAPELAAVAAERDDLRKLVAEIIERIEQIGVIGSKNDEWRKRAGLPS